MFKSVNQSVMPATAKINSRGHLEVGGCDAVELVEKYGSPLYVFDEQTIRQSCRQYKNAFASYPNMIMLFASKALMTMSMCKIIEQEGFGLDLVSGGEIYTAQKAGFPMEKTYFNGNNKTPAEIEQALEAGLGRLAVDNYSELELLHKITSSMNKNAEILLRITPGLECHTHEYIKTGQLDSKFGFDMDQIDQAFDFIKKNDSKITIVGLHAHIGSQVFETQIYADLVDIMFYEFARIREKYGITLTEMNIGGGLGIKYTEEDRPPSMEEISSVIINAVNEHAKDHNFPLPKLIIEPGRSIVGTSGVTLYTVGSFKQAPSGRKYAAVDGGMADNPRPSMYQAKYEAILANRANDPKEEVVTIAGRYCESGDILIKDIKLPKARTGDILCIFDTGAYHYTMSSNYNRVPRPAAVLACCGKSDIIIKRETYEDLTSLDVIPDRLKAENLEKVG